MRDFLRNAAGSVGVMFAVGMVGVSATSAVAVVYSQASSAKASVQSALDAAVLAGASLPSDASDQSRIALAESVFKSNIGSVKVDGLRMESTKFTIEKQNADRIGDVDFISVGVSSFSLENGFSKIFWKDRININAISKARKIVSEPICVLATSATMSRALEIYGNAVFDVANCVVQTNSRNAEAMKQYGKAVGRARQFGVTGQAAGSGWSPQPIAGVDPVQDPFRSLPIPTPGPCVADVEKKLVQANVTLDPGTYCGGLNIKANSNVRLNAGSYIMKDGAFQVGSGATVQGEEVLIVLYGENSILTMNGNSTVSLTSPKSGAYANMQIMSDRSLVGAKKGEEWSTMLGGSKLEYDGTLYLPEQQFWVSGNAQDAVVIGRSPGMIAVAHTFWVQGNARFDYKQENGRNITYSEPQTRFKYGAALIR